MPSRVTVAVSDDGAGASAPSAPSRQDGSGAIAIATFNIRDGRNGGLENAARELDSLGTYVAIV